MKTYLITLLSIALLLAGLYFFWAVPAIDNSYQLGLEQCSRDTDTTYLPGKPYPVYRDTTITKYVKVPATIINRTINSSYNETIISGKDTIHTYTEIHIADPMNPEVEWLNTITHRNVETVRVDTFKIYIPKYIEIEKIVEETSKTKLVLSYAGGILTAVLVFFAVK